MAGRFPSASHAPRGREGDGPGSRSLTPPPSVARAGPPQLPLVGCQVTSCGGPPRALSPLQPQDSSSPPVPGAAASRAPSVRCGRLFLENFCESFRVLRKDFFFSSSDRGLPFGLLLYWKSRCSEAVLCPGLRLRPKQDPAPAQTLCLRLRRTPKSFLRAVCPTGPIPFLGSPGELECA